MIRNFELLGALDALKKLSEFKLPIKTGLKIRAAVRSLGHLAEDIEAERKKLIEQYAIKDADGKPVVIDLGNGIGRYNFGDNGTAYDMAYKELMNLDVAGQPAAIKAHELGDLEVEPMLLIQLGELLEDSV